MAITTYKYAEADGVKVFYREAGPQDAPTILLLHGFPSSSNQFRNLIPILSQKYHVIAPDFPGFGFTEVPKDRNYVYSFASLTRTTGAFLDVLKITKFSVYIFDYGAPTALRLALERPDAVQAIISQNGNAYVEGLGKIWIPIQKYWETGSKSDREAVRAFMLTPEVTKWQYVNGSDIVPDPTTYTLDWTLMSSPQNQEIQLDLFNDYQTNVTLYPDFQSYFRKSQVPLLAVWGKNDEIFIEAGVEPFKRDLPNAETHLLNAGHFAVETHTVEIGKFILEFLAKNGI